MTHDPRSEAAAGADDIAPALDTLRQRIDRLDAEIVRLLNARAACADEIGQLKARVGMRPYQPDRERTVLDHVRQATRGPLDGDAVVRLFERIIDESRRLEYRRPGRA